MLNHFRSPRYRIRTTHSCWMWIDGVCALVGVGYVAADTRRIHIVVWRWLYDIVLVAVSQHCITRKINPKRKFANDP